MTERAAWVEVGVRGRPERGGGGPRLVAAPEPSREAGGVERPRARTHGDRLASADGRGEPALELLHRRAGGQEVRTQRRGHALDVVVVDQLPPVREQARTDGPTAVQRDRLTPPRAHAPPPPHPTRGSTRPIP